MAEIEQENVTYKETLDQFQGKMDQFQGKMDTQLELFRTQKDNTTTVVRTPVETEVVAQLITN